MLNLAAALKQAAQLVHQQPQAMQVQLINVSSKLYYIIKQKLYTVHC